MSNISPFFLRTRTGIIADDIPGSFLYLGVEEGLTYIAPFIEDRLFREQGVLDVCAIAPSELEAQWKTSNADLVIAVAPVPYLDALKGPCDIRALARLHQVIPTSGNYDDILGQLSRRERKRGEEARNNGFTYDVTLEDDLFYEFYRTMHVPTMHHRYGARARSVEERTAYETLFRRGVLVRVHKDGQWVAGSVSHIDDATRTLNARLIGVLNGDDTWRTNGAQNFVYHALIDWAAHHTIDQVDFQGCEPFLTKGTFQYKKRFGTRAVLPKNIFGSLRMLIRGQEFGPQIRRFLVDNPVIGESPNGDLIAQYFYDARHPARVDIPYQTPGLVAAASLDLDELTMMSRAVPPL